MEPLSQVEGFVLAGGGSTRMGEDKALLRLGDVPLIELALGKLRSIGLASPRIAGSRVDLRAYAPTLGDIHPGRGPLSGIEAALAAATRPLCLFLAVDLPLVPAEFLRWMIQRAEITGAPATFPRIHGRPQPLCAVYRRNLLGGITEALEAGEDDRVVPVITRAAVSSAPDPRSGSSSGCSSIDAFDLELLAATYPEIHAFSSFPLYRWFTDCNAPEDLAALVPEASRISAHLALNEIDLQK